MTGIQQIPGEDAAFRHYYSLPNGDRKLMVDLCLEMYGMDRKEQEMILGIARGYMKQKMLKQRAADTARPHLRLVA